MATIIKPGTGSTKINKILKKGGEITFLSGQYNVTDTMQLKSHTHVTCEPGVIFYKKCSEPVIQIRCMPSIIKYKGQFDIIWKGGKFTGITHQGQSNLVEMIHARLITFEDVDFISVRGLHFIEINACKDIVIKNCTFKNHITSALKPHKEAIQIDFANIDGFPFAEVKSRMYDATHCKNIVIEGCSFANCPVCIGTHTVTTIKNKMHEGITIKGNKAVGRKNGTFFKMLNMSDVEVSENNIQDFDCGIYYERYKTGHEAKGGTKELGYFTHNHKVSLHHNEFKNVNYWFYAR